MDWRTKLIVMKKEKEIKIFKYLVVSFIVLLQISLIAILFVCDKVNLSSIFLMIGLLILSIFSIPKLWKCINIIERYS